jgi:hypothetical protein
MKSFIEQYVEAKGHEKAVIIDSKMALIIKSRPKYCPKWLYLKIIRDSVEIVEVRP